MSPAHGFDGRNRQSQRSEILSWKTDSPVAASLPLASCTERMVLHFGAGASWRDDKIHCPAAASCADETRGPFRHRQIAAVARGLLAGINVDAMPAVPAPDTQQQIRPGRAGERRRASGRFSWQQRAHSQSRCGRAREQVSRPYPRRRLLPCHSGSVLATPAVVALRAVHTAIG